MADEDSKAVGGCGSISLWQIKIQKREVALEVAVCGRYRFKSSRWLWKWQFVADKDSKAVGGFGSGSLWQMEIQKVEGGYGSAIGNGNRLPKQLGKVKEKW